MGQGLIRRGLGASNPTSCEVYHEVTAPLTTGPEVDWGNNRQRNWSIYSRSNRYRHHPAKVKRKSAGQDRRSLLEGLRHRPGAVSSDVWPVLTAQRIGFRICHGRSPTQADIAIGENENASKIFTL